MFRNRPITRKLMTVILVTSGTVLIVTCGTFLVYELVTFRQSMVHNLSILAQAIAANSTAALAFENTDDAQSVLNAVAADPHVVAAGVYDRSGHLFASYASSAAGHAPFPAHPDADGYRFGRTSLTIYQPVVIESRRLGTLYLQSDLGALYQRLGLYAGVVLGVIVVAASLAMVLAKRLQGHITGPVLALARTAKTVSAHQDYSARAERFDDDELGQLTDDFNGMLTRIQERDRALIEGQRHYQALAESIPHLVWTCRPDGYCDYLSRQWVEYTGRAAEQQLGARWAEQLHPDDREPVRTAWTAATASGDIFDMEFRIRRADGVYRWFKTRAVPLRDEAGAIVKWFGSNTDVEDLKHAIDNLRRSNADLEQFAYIASHDLQEPLRMVASYTTLLAERYRGHLDDRADKYIHYATDGAKRMQRLVADLLAYSRVGSQGVRLRTVNTGDVLQTTLTSLGELIRESSAEIEVVGALPTVLADEGQLLQVFQNLIANAIKFRSHAPPMVTVEAARRSSCWVFSLKDNGIGIDMRYADRIFNMFQRLHDKDTYEGSGIGLAITKRIVERHGGKIWFESADKAGTTFFFTLPAAPQGVES